MAWTEAAKPRLNCCIGWLACFNSIKPKSRTHMPHLVFIGRPWCVALRTGVSVLCLFYYPPPQLAAQHLADSRGQWLLLLDGPEEDKLSEFILRPEGERPQSPRLSTLIRQRNSRTESDTYSYLIEELKKNLGPLLTSAWVLRLFASQSHLLKSLQLAPFWRQLFVSSKRWVAEWMAGQISGNTLRLTNQHSETK